MREALSPTALSTASLLTIALQFMGTTTVAQSDAEPPTIVAVAVDPKVVEVSGGSPLVTGQLSLHDATSGVTFAIIYFLSPSGAQLQSCFGALSSGTALDGTWCCTTEFPENAESGTWSIQSVYVTDGAGNRRSYRTPELSAAGFPTQLQVSSSEDTAPPTLTAFEFDPKIVDVINGSASVSGLLWLTDFSSGVAVAYFSFLSPSGLQSRDCFGSLSSGTVVDGMWRCTADFAEHAESGKWRVAFLNLTDLVGNHRTFGTPELIAAGFPAQLQVISTEDTERPMLAGLEFDPKRVDVSSGPAQVSVHMSFQDAVSGVGFAEIYFENPSGSQSTGCVAELSSGTVLNGTWSCTVDIRQHGASGTWQVKDVFVTDGVGNPRHYFTSELAGLGYPVTLEVCSEEFGRATDGDGSDAD